MHKKVNLNEPQYREMYLGHNYDISKHSWNLPYLTSTQRIHKEFQNLTVFFFPLKPWQYGLLGLVILCIEEAVFSTVLFSSKPGLIYSEPVAPPTTAGFKNQNCLQNLPNDHWGLNHSHLRTSSLEIIFNFKTWPLNNQIKIA